MEGIKLKTDLSTIDYDNHYHLTCGHGDVDNHYQLK